MKRLLLLILIALCLPAAAAAEKKDFVAPQERGFPDDYRDITTTPETGEVIQKIVDDLQEGPQSNFGVVPIHDNMLFATFRADRFEHQWREHSREVVLWDVVGWIGGDYNKLYLESEGTWDEDRDEVEEAEVELLYGRSITSFWNLRAGVRHDFEPQPERTFLAVGILGMAPLRFEVDANAFLSEDGDVSAKAEVEYELMLTQRLHLVPRLEVGASLQDVPEYETWQGITDVTLGARLLYQLRREIAPYVGVTWNRKVGETQHEIDKRGSDVESAALVAGLRFWF